MNSRSFCGVMDGDGDKGAIAPAHHAIACLLWVAVVSAGVAVVAG